jgi:hypothetical protein
MTMQTKADFNDWLMLFFVSVTSCDITCSYFAGAFRRQEAKAAMEKLAAYNSHRVEATLLLRRTPQISFDVTAPDSQPHCK